jgi:hypothetical protein
MSEADVVYRAAVEAREKCRRSIERRKTWFSVALAVAGGMLGASLVLEFEIWHVWLP